VFPGEFSHSDCADYTSHGSCSAVFRVHAPLLSLILRLLLVANRPIRLEHNAAGGHVPLSCISPSNT